MYLWKIESLLVDLREGLTQKEDMKYYLANGMLGLMSAAWVSWLPLDILLIYVACFVGMILLSYWWNGGDQGTNFISRMNAITFVVTIRGVLFLGLPVIMLLSITFIVVHDMVVLRNPFVQDFLGAIISNGYFLWAYRKYFQKLNKD